MKTLLPFQKSVQQVIIQIAAVLPFEMGEQCNPDYMKIVTFKYDRHFVV